MTPVAQSQIERQDHIRTALKHVLESSVFRGSRRCQDFLTYVVEKTLEGNIEGLKERSISIAVYGRSPDANLAEDSIVRVGAREVRKRLAQFYVEEGRELGVRIDLPPGNYAPAFRFRDADPVMATAVVDLTEHPVAAAAFWTWPRIGWITALVLVVAAASAFVAITARGPSESTEFQRFWQPMFALGGRVPINIAMAHPVVYQLASRPTGNPEKTYQVPLAGEALTGASVLPAVEQFVGLGDALALHRLDTLIHAHGHEGRVRLATRVEFSDLRDSPTILIGGFTNRWMMEFNPKLRFHFGHLPNGRPGILDRASAKAYPLPERQKNGSYREDYLLICRLPNLHAGAFVIVGAGLTQYGTHESARILGDSQALTQVLKTLPAGWETKNLQLVLHSEIVADGPAAPALLAFHVW